MKNTAPCRKMENSRVPLNVSRRPAIGETVAAPMGIISCRLRADQNQSASRIAFRRNGFGHDVDVSHVGLFQSVHDLRKRSKGDRLVAAYEDGRVGAPPKMVQDRRAQSMDVYGIVSDINCLL